MEKLRYCYDQISKLGVENMEPFESAYLVEQYRQYWKPERVKIILLAESHVYTTYEDRSIIVTKLDELQNYPKHYAKFVYCLAYGEKLLTNNHNLHPDRDGTPQFWKLFYSCVNQISCLDNFKDVLKGTPDSIRKANKIQLLNKLKQKGIWLIDTSIIGLYDKNKKQHQMEEILKKSWYCYTLDVVKNANPEKIMCIGIDVGRIVEYDLKNKIGKPYEIVKQPNARLSSEEHIAYYQHFYHFCNT